MTKLHYFLLVAVLIVQGISVNGIDIANPTSASTFTCLKNAGNTFAIIRAFRSTGVLDPNGNSNLNNARSAGLTTDVYMFPCRGKNATTQVNELTSGISSNLYTTIWIDVETNPSSGCSWSGHDATSNCAFLTETINAIKARGKTPGIYSSASMWQGIFGSSSACASAGSVPLWYAHYDNVQAFSDFKAFGGWTQPKLKQFAGDVTVCSSDIDKNWRP
jgi:GH25 family lysozyme M1 (1,4-beta-N-acetylmuramidase)